MNARKILILAASAVCAAMLSGAEAAPEIICGIYGNFTVRPDNDASLAELEQKFLIPMEKAGFNTVDLKIHDFTRSPELFRENLRKISETVRKHGMQLCIYTYFPIVRKADSPHPAAVDESGRLQKRFYNVLAPGLWHDLLKSTRRMAELSREIPILAVKIDLEEMFLRGYVMPFNDEVWNGFRKERGLEYEVPPPERGSFLSRCGLSAAYEAYIENVLAGEVRRFREEIRAINPSLRLGMMPADNKMLYNAFMRELGTEDCPAIIDIWNLYNGNGFSKEVSSSIRHVRKMNASNIAVSWLRFNVCRPENLAGHLYHAAMSGNGWSGWEMKMLSPDQTGLPPEFRLPHGEQTDSYWDAFRETNAAIAADLAEKVPDHRRLPLQALKPLLPELNVEAFSSPAPVCTGKGDRAAAKWFVMRTQQAFFFASGDGAPSQVEIRHLAGNRRPNGIAYAVLDENGNILRRESVMPGESTQFQIVLPERGVGKLIVNGGDGGMAWYAVRILSTHFAFPADKAYFFYGSPADPAQPKAEEDPDKAKKEAPAVLCVDFVTSGPGTLWFASEPNQIFELNADGNPMHLDSTKAVCVSGGKHKISFRAPDRMPEKHYTQDLHLRTEGGNVWISDSEDRQMDLPEESR